MKNHLKLLRKWSLGMALVSAVGFSACNDDLEPDMPPMMTGMKSFDYEFNEGQLLDNPETAYHGDGEGDHPRNLSAKLEINEMENGQVQVTIMLENAINGLKYPVHVHDAADPSTTPNGTPYNETPNGEIFAGMITISDGMGTQAMDTELDFDWLINEYEGFLVVHDPMQELSTVDLTTYLVLGLFAR